MAITPKVWVGITSRGISLKTNTFKLTFHEFVGMCRFESK
jgi:hypothetical protein